MNKRDEEVRDLNRDLRQLREEKFTALELALADHKKMNEADFNQCAASRKKIYEEIMYLRTHFVHVENCAKMLKTFFTKF
jgi:hypothetical protein